ncbi:unnamed protein product [Rangifer tarandus platyrhynchus]|uniref:Secreted protein n=1 Tax=Rangifer tarandus platyrhynchus TaxID=3082113 RepID=A0ABN8Y4N3_RANTA|nr:unnamed protein product [Rangifer tarandus platyrhynchus]
MQVFPAVLRLIRNYCKLLVAICLLSNEVLALFLSSIWGHSNTPPTLTSPVGTCVDSALGCGCPAHGDPSVLCVCSLLFRAAGSYRAPFQPGLGDQVFLGRKAERIHQE